MSEQHPEELERGPANRRGRLEIRLVFAIVIVLIVVGGLYVLFFGSPTQNRLVNDNTNTNPLPGITGNSSRP